MIFIGGSAHGKDIPLPPQTTEFRIPLKRTNFFYTDNLMPYHQYRVLRYWQDGVIHKYAVLEGLPEEEAIILLNQVLHLKEEG